MSIGTFIVSSINVENCISFADNAKVSELFLFRQEQKQSIINMYVTVVKGVFMVKMSKLDSKYVVIIKNQ